MAGQSENWMGYFFILKILTSNNLSARNFNFRQKFDAKISQNGAGLMSTEAIYKVSRPFADPFIQIISLISGCFSIFCFLKEKAQFFPQDLNAERFPHRSTDPKVTASVQVPLKVEIERRKRLFSHQNIAVLLETEGISNEILKTALAPEADLELRFFDDRDFESRTWEEWTLIGTVDDKFAFLPARGFCIATCSWRPCKVLAREEATDLYQVKWADTNEILVLPRLAIMFLAEDPFIFAKRVARAIQARDQVHKGLLYNLYIDSMPVEGVPMLTPEQLNRVMGLALNSNRIRQKSLDTTGVVDELNFEYSRTMNRIVFDKELVANSDSDMLAGIYAPPPMNPDRRDAGIVSDVPPHDHAQQFCQFSFSSFLTKGELITCIVKTKAENQKILAMSLFASHPTKTSKPDEFEHMEVQSIAQMAAYLKDTWLVSLKNSLRNGLKDVGKGWFNLNETKREVYDISKLKKFMTMINFMMEDTLRFLAEDSLASFSTFICGAVSYQVLHYAPGLH